jgi:hypothetical protein
VFQREVKGTLEEKEIQPGDGLADCAHFLSRCLTAGGFSAQEISVPKLVEHLKRRPDTKVLAERVTQERGQRIVDSGIFKRVDMLGYFNIDPRGDYGGRRQYSHSTMFVGKIRSGDVGRITSTRSRAFRDFHPFRTSGICRMPPTLTRSFTSLGTIVPRCR